MHIRKNPWQHKRDLKTTLVYPCDEKSHLPHLCYPPKSTGRDGILLHTSSARVRTLCSAQDGWAHHLNRLKVVDRHFLPHDALQQVGASQSPSREEPQTMKRNFTKYCPNKERQICTAHRSCFKKTQGGDVLRFQELERFNKQATIHKRRHIPHAKHALSHRVNGNRPFQARRKALGWCK